MLTRAEEYSINLLWTCEFHRVILKLVSLSLSCEIYARIVWYGRGKDALGLPCISFYHYTRPTDHPFRPFSCPRWVRLRHWVTLYVIIMCALSAPGRVERGERDGRRKCTLFFSLIVSVQTGERRGHFCWMKLVAKLCHFPNYASLRRI